MSLFGSLFTSASLLLSGQTAKLPVPSDAEILNSGDKKEEAAKDPKRLEGVAVASALFKQGNAKAKPDLGGGDPPDVKGKFIKDNDFDKVQKAAGAVLDSLFNSPEFPEEAVKQAGGQLQYIMLCAANEIKKKLPLGCRVEGMPPDLAKNLPAQQPYLGQDYNDDKIYAKIRGDDTKPAELDSEKMFMLIRTPGGMHASINFYGELLDVYAPHFRGSLKSQVQEFCDHMDNLEKTKQSYDPDKFLYQALEKTLGVTLDKSKGLSDQAEIISSAIEKQYPGYKYPLDAYLASRVVEEYPMQKGSDGYMYQPMSLAVKFKPAPAPIADNAEYEAVKAATAQKQSLSSSGKPSRRM